MGGKVSKQTATFSRYDDLVVDHVDALDKLRQVLCLASHPLRTPAPSCPGSPRKTNERLAVQVHCSGESPKALAAASAVEEVDAESMLGLPQQPRAACDDQPAAAAAAAPAKGASAGTRAQVDAIFADVDTQEQEQERACALATLASAARDGGSGPALSGAERLALRERGAAARAAEEERLAQQLATGDAELQRLDASQRCEWFEHHAQQQDADAAEPAFEDEWADLPPEVLAVVAELAARC